MIARFVLVASLALAGCGVATSQSVPVPVGVLPEAAVPRLPAVTHLLTAQDVSKDSTISDLVSRLQEWGYVGGWERTFQGESRRLTLVVSRSLTFQERSGAVAFVRYMREHLAGFFPFALIQRLGVTGGSGWIFEPPECACHMASPYFVGVTASGREVLWLEINGPLATAQALRSLFAEIPSASTSG